MVGHGGPGAIQARAWVMAAKRATPKTPAINPTATAMPPRLITQSMAVRRRFFGDGRAWRMGVSLMARTIRQIEAGFNRPLPPLAAAALAAEKGRSFRPEAPCRSCSRLA